MTTVTNPSKPKMAVHVSKKKKCIACAIIIMLLVFLANLNGNLGLYFTEKYENSGINVLNYNNTKPQAIHIAYGKIATEEIIVLWGSEVYSRSSVMYSTQQNNLHHRVHPSYQRIVYTNEAGLRYWYRAELTGLTSGTRYFYSITSHSYGTSQMFTFQTASNKSPEFLVFGDLGLRSTSLNAIKKEGLARAYAAMLHLGDFAYNLHSLGGRNGDMFLNSMEETAAHVPYLTTPGDHERAANFYQYRFRFSMPGVPWPMPEEKLWYSIDIGNVHLISYNTDTYFSSIPNIGRQFLWLVDDLHLATKNRQTTPWIIVIGHKPLYCSATGPLCQQPHSKLRAGVEELFYTFGVDLVLQGHVHHYERSWPMYKGMTVAKHYSDVSAPVYITHGTSGNRYRTARISKMNDWTAYLMSEREKESFGRLKIHNKTHLTWTTTLTSNLQVIDSFTMKKVKHGPNGDIESFIRKARANQQLDQLLLGQNLSVAKGDLDSGWRPGMIMLFAFMLVILLFLFRVTVVDFMETLFHRASYVYIKFTGRPKK